MVRFVLLVFVFTFAYFFLVFFDLDLYLSLEGFIRNRDLLAFYVRQHPGETIFFYTLLYLVVAGLAVPIAPFISMLAGFLFDFWLALLLANTTATAGAVIAQQLSKYIYGAYFLRRYQEKIQWFHAFMDEYGIKALWLLRLLPVLPFFLTNILSGFTRISLRQYVVITFVGMLPLISLFVYLGRQVIAFNQIELLESRQTLYMAAFLILLLQILPFVSRALLSYWKKRGLSVTATTSFQEKSLFE